MEGIEKITARIAQDAQAEISRLTAETEEKVQAVLTNAAAQAQQEANEIVEKGRMAASERLERLNSASQMERRKLELAARQEVLGEAFALALEASSSGKEQLILSQKDRAAVGKQVVMAVNDALVKERAPSLPEEVTRSKVGAFVDKLVHNTTAAVTGTGLTLSEETRDLKGGFIMVDGDVEINCAFETLVRLQREQMEKKVADTLFQS